MALRGLVNRVLRAKQRMKLWEAGPCPSCSATGVGWASSCEAEPQAWSCVGYQPGVPDSAYPCSRKQRANDLGGAICALHHDPHNGGLVCKKAMAKGHLSDEECQLRLKIQHRYQCPKWASLKGDSFFCKPYCWVSMLNF